MLFISFTFCLHWILSNISHKYHAHISQLFGLIFWPFHFRRYQNCTSLSLLGWPLWCHHWPAPGWRHQRRHGSSDGAWLHVENWPGHLCQSSCQRSSASFWSWDCLPAFHSSLSWSSSCNKQSTNMFFSSVVSEFSQISLICAGTFPALSSLLNLPPEPLERFSLWPSGSTHSSCSLTSSSSFSSSPSTFSTSSFASGTPDWSLETWSLVPPLAAGLLKGAGVSSFLFFFSFFSFCVFSFLSLALPLALAFGFGFCPLKVFGGVFGKLGLLPAFELWKLKRLLLFLLLLLFLILILFIFLLSLILIPFIFLLFGFHGHLRSLAVARAPRLPGKYLAVVFTGLLRMERQKVCNWMPGFHYLYMLICWGVTWRLLERYFYIVDNFLKWYCTLVNKHSNHFPMKTRDDFHVSFRDKSVSMQPFGLLC